MPKKYSDRRIIVIEIDRDEVDQQRADSFHGSAQTIAGLNGARIVSSINVVVTSLDVRTGLELEFWDMPGRPVSMPRRQHFQAGQRARRMNELNALPGDHAGHLLAYALGGPNSVLNLVPMHAAVNSNRTTTPWAIPNWFQTELFMAEFLLADEAANRRVTWHVDVLYDYDDNGMLVSNRPAGFHFLAETSTGLEIRGYQHNGDTVTGYANPPPLQPANLRLTALIRKLLMRYLEGCREDTPRKRRDNSPTGGGSGGAVGGFGFGYPRGNYSRTGGTKKTPTTTNKSQSGKENSVSDAVVSAGVQGAVQGLKNGAGTGGLLGTVIGGVGAGLLSVGVVALGPVVGPLGLLVGVGLGVPVGAVVGGGLGGILGGVDGLIRGGGNGALAGAQVAVAGRPEMADQAGRMAGGVAGIISGVNYGVRGGLQGAQIGGMIGGMAGLAVNGLANMSLPSLVDQGVSLETAVNNDMAFSDFCENSFSNFTSPPSDFGSIRVDGVLTPPPC